MTSLNITPNHIVSLNLRPRVTFSDIDKFTGARLDKFTGARLEIQDSSVQFQFGSSSRPRAISEIELLTGANIGDGFNINLQSQFGSNLEINDFNGDGLDDLAVTAPRAGESGLTFIYFGTSNGLVLNQILDGTAPGVNNVTGSGDFNGDGLDDLAFADPDSGLSGQVIISFGTSSGLSTEQILEPL